MNEWLGEVKQQMETAKSEDKASRDDIRRSFAKWLIAVDPNEQPAKSKMLDSPDMEERYAVKQLTKMPDGTTLVRYYFSDNSVEASALSMNDPLLHTDSTAFMDENLRGLARDVTKSIVAETGARIKFEEVSSLAEADVAFVQSPHCIEADNDHVPGSGAAGRAHNKNFIDVMDERSSKETIERAFRLLSSDQRERAKAMIIETYGDKYSKNADIFTILAYEAEKKLFAHEIEHILGAKHPDAAGAVRVTEDSDSLTYKQSIMGESVVAGSGIDRSALGRVLGALDVEWYRRHFGVKEIRDSEVLAPMSPPANMPTLKSTVRVQRHSE